MWLCTKCHEPVKSDWDVCWKCGTSKDGVPDPTFQQHVDDSKRELAPPASGKTISCLRCHCSLKYLGRRSFEDGSGNSRGDMIYEAIDLLGSIFRQQERLDVYCCPECGKVELFVDGIGDKQRNETD